MAKTVRHQRRGRVRNTALHNLRKSTTVDAKPVPSSPKQAGKKRVATSGARPKAAGSGKRARPAKTATKIKAPQRRKRGAALKKVARPKYHKVKRIPLPKMQKRNRVASRARSIFDRLRSALKPTITSGKSRQKKAGRGRLPPPRIVSPKRARKRTKAIRRTRPHASMRFFSDGKAVRASVTRRTASVIGGYLAAVRRLLDANDIEPLEQYAGKSVKDVRGIAFPLETRPNVLYRLNAAAEPFEEIYRLSA